MSFLNLIQGKSTKNNKFVCFWALEHFAGKDFLEKKNCGYNRLYLNLQFFNLEDDEI